MNREDYRYIPSDFEILRPYRHVSVAVQTEQDRAVRRKGEPLSNFLSQYASTEAGMRALDNLATEMQTGENINSELNEFIDKWKSDYSMDEIKQAVELSDYNLKKADKLLMNGFC